jgi:hypothetical protein
MGFTSIQLSLETIVLYQAALFAICCAVLSRIVQQQFGWLPSAALLLALVANPFLTRYQFEILSESIWLSALSLWLACLVKLLLDGTNQRMWAVLFGLCTGALCTIRPGTIALMPILLIVPALLYGSVSLR